MEVYEQFLRVTNRRASSAVFRLEPWAEEYDMPTGATFLVCARGPRSDCLTVDLGDDDIEVWAWHGSDVWLFQDGEELGRDYSTRMSQLSDPPKMPPASATS